MEDHLADYPTYRLLGNCSWLAGSEEIPEVVQASFVIPFQPVVYPSYRLYEYVGSIICARLTHVYHAYRKHPCAHPVIFFLPVGFSSSSSFGSFISRKRKNDLQFSICLEQTVVCSDSTFPCTKTCNLWHEVDYM